MMLLKELLAQYPKGAVESVVCLKRGLNTLWVVGKVYRVLLDATGNQAVSDGNAEYSEPTYAEFGVHELVSYKPTINPHMTGGKLPTLVTGFNPNKVEVKPNTPAHSHEELESLIRVGIDIQDALATNAPDLDRALVDLWFELKGTKQ